MGFGSLPKQPTLSKEIWAFSSVFQVCFKCVIFFYLSCISIYLLYLVLYWINNCKQSVEEENSTSRRENDVEMAKSRMQVVR